MLSPDDVILNETCKTRAHFHWRRRILHYWDLYISSLGTMYTFGFFLYLTIYLYATYELFWVTYELFFDKWLLSLLYTHNMQFFLWRFQCFIWQSFGSANFTHQRCAQWSGWNMKFCPNQNPIHHSEESKVSGSSLIVDVYLSHDIVWLSSI